MKNAPVILWAAWLMAASAPAGENNRAVPTNAPARIALHDQFETLRILIFPTTNLTLLTIADKVGSTQLAAWVMPIQERFPKGLAIEGIADVSAVPRPLRTMVRRRFQQAQSHSVMLDWSGDTARQFAISPKQANVLLVDCRGNIVKRITGKATNEAIKDLCATIEQNLAEEQKRGEKK
jgi:hypothetical protein